MTEDNEADKTPSRPSRLFSGTAVCLLDMAQTARAIAHALDRGNALTRAAFGRQLIDLGREFVEMGKTLVDAITKTTGPGGKA
jgi:hypothetical protein